MYKQLLIIRKDIPMSLGKICAQSSHGSMAFISHLLQNGKKKKNGDEYELTLTIDKDIMEQWFCGMFTKVVCGAKNKNQLLKAVKMAEEMGMIEGRDFFVIKDNCLTDIEPEEYDENGVGRTITCIGFRPMGAEVIEKISKKFQLLK